MTHAVRAVDQRICHPTVAESAIAKLKRLGCDQVRLTRPKKRVNLINLATALRRDETGELDSTPTCHRLRRSSVNPSTGFAVQ